MIDLPEYVWSDIERDMDPVFASASTEGRAEVLRMVFREAIDRIVERVDMERARQVRRSMIPSAQDVQSHEEAPNEHP